MMIGMHKRGGGAMRKLTQMLDCCPTHALELNGIHLSLQVFTFRYAPSHRRLKDSLIFAFAVKRCNKT